MTSTAGLLTTAMLAAAAVLAVIRALARGSLADRALGLDMVVIVLAAAITADAARTGETTFLTWVTVVALIAFVATVTIARFLEARPPEETSDPHPGDDR